jgi:hypothetical protein
LTVKGLVLRDIANGYGINKKVSGDVSLSGIDASDINTSAIEVNSTNVEIDNIQIQNCNSGINISSRENGSTLTIKNINFTNVRSPLMSRFSENVVIEDVTIEYAGTSPGSFFHISSNNFNNRLTRISNCRIITNITSESRGYSGALIAIWEGDVEIDGVTIDNLNVPSHLGISISSGRNIVISNSSINNTRNSDSYTTWVNPSTREELYTTGAGAGIWLSGDTAIISNTVITNAKVYTPYSYDKTVPFRGSGGGIYWEYTRSLTIRDSRLENCTASYAGGAIYPTSGFTRINTEFINCYP